MANQIIDKALNYLGNRMNGLVATQTKQTTTGTINGNAGLAYTLDMSKSGYTPVGVLQLQNNAGSTVVISGYWWSGDGNTLNIFMKNTSSTAQTGIYAIATVAYIKLGGG